MDLIRVSRGNLKTLGSPTHQKWRPTERGVERPTFPTGHKRYH